MAKLRGRHLTVEEINKIATDRANMKCTAFANELYTILEWHTHIDCVAKYKDAERIRKKYAPESIKWQNFDEDKEHTS